MRVLSWALIALLTLDLAAAARPRKGSRARSSSSSNAVSSAGQKRVVCYYTNWSVYRPGNAKFSPQNINPYLCTHLIYAFGGLSKENGLRPFDKYQDVEQGGYAKFNGLKSYNKDLKTLLAIGGWNEGSSRFSPLVADEERRAEFVKNALKFLRQNHFDGLDLDWEYPAFRDGGKPRDRENYALLVKELREEFEREHAKTGRPRLLLTMAVPAGLDYIDKGFDVAKLNKYLDFMNILSYDYHSAFEPVVNHHAPLFSLEEDNEYNFDAQLNIEHTVKHYMELGAEAEKLVLGIPTYGRSYTLFNPIANELGSAADGPGEQGDSTREKGYLAYFEICSNLNSSDWKVVQPAPNAMGPYAFKGNQWVCYDDIDIVKKKAEYVLENSLGGIMFWAIDNDDFRGKCHGRSYPLIEAGKEAMLRTTRSSNDIESETTKARSRPRTTEAPVRESSGSKRNQSRRKGTRPRTSSSTTSTSSTTTEKAIAPTTPSYTTPEPPTTPDPGSDFKCKDEGFFPHPRDCKKYFWCLDSGPSNLGIVAHQFTCPSGLVFNKAADSCDYSRNVICNKKSKTTSDGGPSTRPPIKAATSSTTRFSSQASSASTTSTTTSTTTTTTTTEAPASEEEDEEEYEEYDEDDEGGNREEDPQAIKELIQLIKKLGGLEQLEKQFNLQNSGQIPDKTVTSSLVSRTLYDRILNSNSGRNVNAVTTTSRPSSGTNKYVSPYHNRPERPQNEGLDKVEDTTVSRRKKPNYVNIRTERPKTPAPPVEDEEEDIDDEEEYIDEEESDKKIAAKVPQREYVTLQRTRPTTPKFSNIEETDDAEEHDEEEDDEDDDTILHHNEARKDKRIRTSNPEYTTLKRNRPSTPQSTETSSPRYVTITRNRPTTESNTINIEDYEATSAKLSQQSRPLRTKTGTIVEIDDNLPTVTREIKTENTFNEEDNRNYKPTQRSRKFRPKSVVEETETVIPTTLKDASPIHTNEQTATRSYTQVRRFRPKTESTSEANVISTTKEEVYTVTPIIISTSSDQTQKYSTIRELQITRSSVSNTPNIDQSSGSSSTKETKFTDPPSSSSTSPEEPKRYTPSTEDLLIASVSQSTIKESDSVQVTSERLLQNGIQEVKSEGLTNEALQETTPAVIKTTIDRTEKSTTNKQQTIIPSSTTRNISSRPRVKQDGSASQFSLNETTTQTSSTRHRGTPRLVRRRKFGNNDPKGRNSTTTTSAPTVASSTRTSSVNRYTIGNRTRKFNTNQKRGSSSAATSTTRSTAEDNQDPVVADVNDMQLLESMEHPATDVEQSLHPPVTDSLSSLDLNDDLVSRRPSVSSTISPSTVAALNARRALFARPREQSSTPSITVQDTATPYSTVLSGPRSSIKGFYITKDISSRPLPSGTTAIFGSTEGSIPLPTPFDAFFSTVRGKDSSANTYATYENVDEYDPAEINVNRQINISTTLSPQVYSESLFQKTRESIPSTSALDSSADPRIYETSEAPFVSSTLAPALPRKVLFSRQKIRPQLTTPDKASESYESSGTTGKPTRPSYAVSSQTQGVKGGQIITVPASRAARPNRGRPFSKISATTPLRSPITQRPRVSIAPIVDYEYYDDEDDAVLDVAPLSKKVKIHSDGYIECLDQGNFPHPFSCKKFISCAKMENGELLGWEYTCPRRLSFDPIGGICNWSAGLGCKE